VQPEKGELPIESSLNAELLRRGYAQVDFKSTARMGKIYLDKLRSFESQARRERRGMWEYGDFDLDEREDPL
jgi:endonuclease YncB( thermonuclease family)